MTDPNAEDLILPYLAGKLHGEQAERARIFLETSAQRRGALSGLRVALQHEELHAGAPDIQVSLAQFRNRLDQYIAQDAVQNTVPTVTLNPDGVKGARTLHGRGFLLSGRRTLPLGMSALRWWGWASIVVAVIAVVSFNHLVSRSTASTPKWTYATTTGQQATLTLDDGTRVTLAPNTTVRLLAFGPRERTLALDGEAYFDVARASGAPFVVQTGRVSIRVLGTTFTVQHYANDRGVRVVVRTGKVSVQAQGSQRPGVTLTAGGAGEVDDSSATTISASNAERYTSWLDGQLVYHDAPIADVLAELSRWYGYQFRIENAALAQQSLTAWISTRSAAEAFATLKAVLDVELIFRGNVVTLRPRERHVQGRAVPNELISHTREVGR